MSSPASRRRQRQRRRAQERLWTVQSQLAERQAVLVSYDRVIADMEKHYNDRKLSLFSGAQAITLVTELRDVTKRECIKLKGDVRAQDLACKQLADVGALCVVEVTIVDDPAPPATPDPKEILLL